MSDNMAMIIQVKKELQQNSTTGFNQQPSDSLPLKPRASPAVKLSWLHFGVNVARCLLPCYLMYQTLGSQRNSVLSMAELSLFYAAVLAVHYFLIDPHLFKALASFDLRSAVMRIKMTFWLPFCASAMASFAVGYLYSSFVPFGPRSLTVFLAAGGLFSRFAQWVCFLVLHVAVLPAFETAYYFLVVYSFFYHTHLLCLAVAVAYGFMHFAWICLAVDGVGWVVLLTLGCTALGWVLLVAVRRETILKALAMRAGVGLGVFTYLLWLVCSFGEKTAAPSSLTAAV